jgi:hypothetical protein
LNYTGKTDSKFPADAGFVYALTQFLRQLSPPREKIKGTLCIETNLTEIFTSEGGLNSQSETNTGWRAFIDKVMKNGGFLH